MRPGGTGHGAGRGRCGHDTAGAGAAGLPAGARGQPAARAAGRGAALLAALAEGRPVVVLQNLGLDLAPVWHYAVLVAYDLQGAGEVVLRSGLVRRLPLVLPLFENTWVRAGSWAMVVTPPGTWPSGAEEPAALEAAVGFERALALRAYAAAVQRWPDSLGLRVGLGNAAFASGQKALAADAFQTAAQRHRSAPAWINLGHTLLDAGLVDAAWRVALEAEYLNDPAFRAETTALLREVYGRRLARGDAGTKDSSAPR
ncbi:PA2778 family cysteine peptidase [Piscinibacter sakaiensis]|uniref:PA2778 family cysteine peptidase n=1 Tax=Piscinibacter sakaiensis TaxID=1547922 RepID=UPI00372AA6DF